MKYSCILLFVIVSFFSCKSSVNSQTGNDTNAIGQRLDLTKSAYADTTFLDRNGTPHKYLGRIPDSLRTQEQKRLIKSLQDVSVNYISVKDNHMVVDITRQQFIAKGIPEKYYDILLQNIRDNNIFLDSKGIKDVDKMMKDQREEYLKSQKEEQK